MVKPSGLEKVTTEDLFGELSARTTDGVTIADLYDLLERFAQFDKQLPLPPPTAITAPSQSPEAEFAPEALAAQHSPAALSAPMAPVAGEAEKTPDVRVIVAKHLQANLEDYAKVVQTMLMAFSKGQLNEHSARLVRIAAEIELLELWKVQHA